MAKIFTINHCGDCPQAAKAVIHYQGVPEVTFCTGIVCAASHDRDIPGGTLGEIPVWCPLPNAQKPIDGAVADACGSQEINQAQSERPEAVMPSEDDFGVKMPNAYSWILEVK